MADTDVIGDTAEKMSTEDIPSEGITASEDTPKEDITEEESEPSKTIKEELLKVETEEIKPDSVVQETVDENGDVFEETTEVTRKVVKRTMKITETSSTTKTTTMTTPAKLYGKDLSEYDEVDVDALLAQLSPEEINILAKEVDPDDNFLPPNQRCSYECTKDPTGPLNRKKLIEHINKEALETPDLPELEPFVKGTVRGKKWVPPPRDEREVAADEQIAIDLGDEYEHALSDATQEEIIDLAAILGFHSMMNQDQYHASLLNKGQPVGMGWDGITKSTTQKLYPMDPPNNTDVEESIKRVKDDDPKLIELNLNNIKNISDEKFEQLFDALPQNEHLEVLSLTNVGLTDKTALLLAEAIEKSKTLRVLNVETNFINPPVVVTLVKALLKARTIEEFRASNQRSTVLGNKIEMEITDLVEKNTSLLRLGLHLEFNDARHRVAAHLQRNIDRNEHELRKGTSSSPIPNATSIKASAAAGTVDDLSSLLSLQKTIKAKSPKPMHIVLTPQERIDSKSELIASLASQKLSDRGREEISLAVPQIGGVSRSPSKDRPSPVKVQEPLPPPKKEKSPIKARELSPKTVDIKPEAKPLEKKDEKRVSPTRHPKIGELRDSTLSKAVDDGSLSLQENGAPPEVVEAPLEAKPLPPEESTQSIVAETKDVVEPMIDGSKAKILDDLSQPKIDETSLTSLTPKKEDIPLPTPEINVDLAQTPVEVSISKDIENVNQTAPEKVQTELTDRDSTDLSKNRERLSESVSPSRHLEDKMTLLRAKIDSFAEVADEKLSSIRSKFDDLARDQAIENAKKTSENIKPKPVPLLKEADKANDLVKPVDELPQPVDPTTLPPKAPLKGAVIPPKPLVKTPNSVGITFLYQKQMVPKAEIRPIPSVPTIPEPSQILDKLDAKTPEQTVTPANSSNIVPEVNIKIIDKVSVSKEAIVDQVVVEPSQNLSKIDTKSPEKTIKSEIPNPSKSISEANVNIIDKVSEEKPVSELSNSESKNPTSSRTEVLPLQANQPTSDTTDVSPTNKAEPEQRTSSLNNPIKSPDNPQNADITPTINNLATINPIFNLPSETVTPQVDKTTALSKLSIKMGECLHIDPITKVEIGIQPPAQPSPLSRLTVKKGDPQKIDPVKTTTVGTQSAPKPNPLSLLSVKRGDRFNINPVTKSEISTQSEVEPKSEAASQTIEEEPIKTIEESTQTPLVFSSLAHDYIFPGLRRVPYLPRPKTINIGGGDRVIVKPSSKPINEVLMLLYPVFQDYSNVKPQETDPPALNFGLEENLVKPIEPESTIKDLEAEIQTATEVSETILENAPQMSEEPIKSEENFIEETTSIKTEIEIPLVEEPNTPDDRDRVATATRYETKYTAVEKVSALSRTTIASEEHVKVIDKAYKSVAEVTSSEGEHVSTTSIRSANMWESLSSNLIKASEQTLIDISKAGNLGDTGSSTRTKIGKVSVYSSIEDLSHSSRSKYSDRRTGGVIKTVERTSIYSSTEDLPVTAYTRYSDRYGDKPVSKTSVYSSTEDLPQYSRTKQSDRYDSDLLKSLEKQSAYSSMEDLLDVPYTKYSDRYSDTKAAQYPVDVPTPYFMANEDVTLLPRSKFSDRYKDDHVRSVETHRTQPKFPVSTKVPRSQYKSVDHLPSRSYYKSTDDYSHRTKISDRSTHNVAKSHESSLQTAILSSISRNQSALRPYTYVPTSISTDLSIDHIRSRPSSPAAIHTSTLQLNISPSGISELPPPRTAKYVGRESIGKPKIVVSRPKEENRSFRAISPLERTRPSAGLLSPYRRVSDPANDDLIDESSQSTLEISSASAASTADYSASTTTTTTSTTNTTPKKRVNIMDTIKMLKNRVRDVITTEDRFSETHRLPSSSSQVEGQDLAPERHHHR